MGAAEEFSIGSDVGCCDGRCGVLSRVVVDPIADAIAYLDVESKHGRHGGHLVPISLVATATAKEIRLKCSKAEFEALEPAEENEFPARSRGTVGLCVRAGGLVGLFQACRPWQGTRPARPGPGKRLRP